MHAEFFGLAAKGRSYIILVKPIIIIVTKNIFLYITGLVLFITSLSLQGQDSPQIVNRSTTIQRVDGKEYFFHAVLQGQTAFSIAKAYGVTVEDIFRENPDLQNQELRYDQIIRIPVKQQISSEEPQRETVKEVNYIEHQVKRRETVYGISRMYDIEEVELLKHNPQARTGLKPNMMLKIPRYRETVLNYIEYTVPPRQTLFSISREFGVTIADLEKVNPELTEGLKAGQTIKIPVEPPTQQQPPYIYDEDDEPQPTVAEPVVADPYCKDPQTKDHYKVALLIPLYLENIENEDEMSQKERERSFSFLEYYEGIVLALDSVRAMGADIRLTVIDVCDSEIKARSAIWNSDLGNMDLIIGPFLPNVFPIVANFAKDRDIPIVSPLYSDDRDMLRRFPNMFQVTPDVKTQMNDMASYVVDRFPEDNVILVHSNQPGISNLISGFKNTLNEELNRWEFMQDSINMAKLDGYFFNGGVYVGERISNVYVLNDSLLKAQKHGNNVHAIDFQKYASRDKVKEVIYSRDGIDTLKGSLDTNRRNILISLMGGEANIANYTRQLNQLRDTFDLTVFGVHQWRDYRSVDYNYLQNLNVHIFTSEFIDYDDPASINYIKTYSEQNHVEPGVMGFKAVETGMYFFTALMQYGPQFYRCMDVINQSKPYHIPFWFEKTAEDAGWENKYVYIYTYDNYKLKDVRDPKNKMTTQKN